MSVNEQLAEQLMSLGLRANEARAYLSMVKLGAASAAEIADAAGITRPKVYEALKSLEREGFCLPSVAGKSRFQAVAPELALAELLTRRDRQRADSARHDQEAMRTVLEALPDQRVGEEVSGANGYMGAVVGREDMLDLFRGIANRAENQLDIILASPQVEPPDTGLQAQMDALARGVTVRVIYDSRLSDVHSEYGRLLEAGAQARELASAPLRLALRDSGAEGLVALVARSGSEFFVASVQIIHADLVAPFQILFNRQWRQARPLGKRSRRADVRER